MLIVLAVLQRYRPAAGLGTLISLMVPYSLALGAAWTVLLVAWYFTGCRSADGAAHFARAAESALALKLIRVLHRHWPGSVSRLLALTIELGAAWQLRNTRRV